MLRAEGRSGVLRLLAALLRRLTPDLVLPLLGIAASVLIGFLLSQALLEAQARAVAVAFALMAGYITAERLAAYLDQPLADPLLGLPQHHMAAAISRDIFGPSHPLDASFGMIGEIPIRRRPAPQTPCAPARSTALPAKPMCG